MAEKIRRLFVCALALALAVGLVTHPLSVGDTGAKASDMATMSMDTPTGMPMHKKCDGCAGDEKGLMPTACSAFCGSVVASPMLPVLFEPIAIATLSPIAGTVATGHTGPPDPYPPKPVVLS